MCPVRTWSNGVLIGFKLVQAALTTTAPATATTIAWTLTINGSDHWWIYLFFFFFFFLIFLCLSTLLHAEIRQSTYTRTLDTHEYWVCSGSFFLCTFGQYDGICVIVYLVTWKEKANLGIYCLLPTQHSILSQWLHFILLIFSELTLICVHEMMIFYWYLSEISFSLFLLSQKSNFFRQGSLEILPLDVIQ